MHEHAGVFVFINVCRHTCKLRNVTAMLERQEQGHLGGVLHAPETVYGGRDQETGGAALQYLRVCRFPSSQQVAPFCQGFLFGLLLFEGLYVYVFC